MVFVGFNKLLILLFIVVLDVFSYVIVHLDVIFEPSVSLSFKHLFDLVCISFLFKYLKAIFELFIKLRRCNKLLDLILDVFFDPFARWQKTIVFFGSCGAGGNFSLLAFGLSFLLVYLVLPRKDYFQFSITAHNCFKAEVYVLVGLCIWELIDIDACNIFKICIARVLAGLWIIEGIEGAQVSIFLATLVLYEKFHWRHHFINFNLVKLVCAFDYL